MEDVSRVPWFLAVGACGLVYVFASFASVAFRVLSPVTLEALVERIGAHRTEFLRKSLRAPGAFWFSLTLASSAAMLLFLLVVFAGDLSVRLGGLELALRPTGRIVSDAVLFVVLLVAIAVVEFVLPVVVSRIDPIRFVEGSLPVMRAIHFVFAPLTELLESWLRVDPLDPEATGSEELMAYIDVGKREGILEKDEGKLLQNLVTFGDTRAYEVMTPRTDVVGIESTATIGELSDLVAKSRFSRIPVHGGQLDDIVGIAMIKDAVEALRAGHAEQAVTTIMRPTYLVPESKKVAELLPDFQERRQQLAIVVDEYGGTAGVITVEDLLEELVGEIREEHEQPGEDIAKADDGSWLVRGRASLHDVGQALDADIQLDDASTVGGLMLTLFERVPAAGEMREHAEHRFEVLQADRKRVQRVRITALAGEGDGGRVQQGVTA